jgi:penicillin-binding protein
MRKIYVKLHDTNKNPILWYMSRDFWHVIKKIQIVKLIKWLLISVLLFLCLATGIIYGYVTSLVRDEPLRSNEEIRTAIEENNITGYVYFNDRSLVGKLQSGEDRRLTTMDEIPIKVKNAFLAIEDNHFYSHYGVDIRGTSRAIKQQLKNENIQTGGSTITQQLARRVFLSMEQTYERKAAEILLALRMETFLSKEEILLAYLTKIYFGRGANGNNLYGIEAAAEGIFDVKNLNDLSHAQIAYLAGLPQRPNYYSAFNSNGTFEPDSFDHAMKRQKHVLHRMKQEDLITVEQFNLALEYDLEGSLSQTKAKDNKTYPYLMVEVERRAAELLEETHKQLISKGYKIYTTIDPTIYEEMKRIAENKQNFTENHPDKGVEQVGAIMIDNHSGAIMGLIGGRDFHEEQLNHATQMIRQPGSAMKPIAAYLPALEKGLIQPASIIDDVPILLENGGEKIHIPDNWDQTFHGLITAREALKWSYNIPALKIFNDLVGINEAWSFVEKLGITSITEKDLHAKTGGIGGLTYGVSVEELTNAYAAIGNQGVFNNTHMISRIENAQGELIYKHQTNPEVVFSEQTAYLMTDMLKSVVESGTASDLKKEYEHSDKVPFVGKTGSTQNDADAWFIGYTPDISVGVWAGYAQSQYSLSRTNCSETVGCGKLRAKKIWAKIMNNSIEKKEELFPTREFSKPNGITEMTVSRYTGKLPNDEILKRKDTITDIFNKEYIPTEMDDAAGMTSYVVYNQAKYLAHPETPNDMVFESFLVKREKPVSVIIQEIKAAQSQISAGERKDISHYFPQDIELDAPAETDPRKDDGNVPRPPKNLKMKTLKGHMEITFQLNIETDVVGYRLYSSVNGREFQYIQGKPISSGAEANFKIENFKRGTPVFAVTAVDVAGRESEPSNIMSNDRDSVRDWFNRFLKNRD